MATASYAEVLKKHEDSYETENLEANLIVSEASLSGSSLYDSDTSNHSYLNASSYDIINSSEGEDKFNENYDATVADNSDIYITSRETSEKGRGGGGKKSGKKKLSKRTIILSATLDIALAGLLIGWIYKKPTATKIKIGVGSIGLLSFYGVQWITYKKYKDD